MTTSTAAATAGFDLIHRFNEITVPDEFDPDITQFTEQLFVYDKIDFSLLVLEIRFFGLIQCKTEGWSAAAMTSHENPDIFGAFLPIDNFCNFTYGFRIRFNS